MRSLFFIFAVVLTWGLTMINTSGLGLVHDTPGKTNMLIGIWCVCFVLTKRCFLKTITSNSILAFFTILSFVIFPLLTTGSKDGLSYLMMVPLVYCFSELKVTEKVMLLSGYIIAGLGLFVLFVYTKTEILSGWNDNHISMIGLFSYIYYSVSLYGNMTGRKATIGLAISLLFVVLLFSTNSRSGIIFIVLSVILSYRSVWFKVLLTNRNFLFYALNVPLIVSLIFIYFPDFFVFQYFEEWSIENFGKSAFNGRDILWRLAYERLFETYLIGKGEIFMNHHNSAVAVLSVFGVMGYVCWYKMLAKPLLFIRDCLNDKLTLAFMSSFLLIFWQQSFELGFVHSSPNMIPYMILGLGIARVRTLNKKS